MNPKTAIIGTKGVASMNIRGTSRIIFHYPGRAFCPRMPGARKTNLCAVHPVSDIREYVALVKPARSIRLDQWHPGLTQVPKRVGLAAALERCNAPALPLVSFVRSARLRELGDERLLLRERHLFVVRNSLSETAAALCD